MTQTKWMIIANPKAGNNTVLNEWSLIENELKGENIEYEVIFSKSKYHSIELTIKAIRDGYRKFIAIGGDGTIHEVVNGIFMQSEVPYSEFTLGVIPTGSGNDWVKSAGIPNNYSECAKIISKGETLLQDIFRVDFFDSKVPHTRYVINGSGVGLDALICRECNLMKSAGKGGKLIYVRAAVKSLLGLKYKEVEVVVDGEPFYKGKVVSIALANGPYSGGGMVQAPGASISDGLANITVIGEISIPKIILKFKELFTGNIYTIKEVKNRVGRHVQIKVFEDDLPLEIDGEFVGGTPIELSVIPQSLKVVVGNLS